jgi:Arc/MetJ-type ribon-helix-helix transcriptional regulator
MSRSEEQEVALGAGSGVTPSPEQKVCLIPTRRPERIRTTLDLTPEMKALLDRLARRYASQADALRHAIYLLNAVKEGEAHGLSAALVAPDGEVKARLVGI